MKENGTVQHFLNLNVQNQIFVCTINLLLKITRKDFKDIPILCTEKVSFDKRYLLYK